VKSYHLPGVALAAALAFLALASSAQTPPKTASPSGFTPAQTEERIKQLEARADAAEKAAANAAMEKDYITRIQKQYESYYEKAFNTQVAIIGIISLLIGLALWIAARFSLNVFERLTKSTLSEATGQLRAEYAQALAAEAQKLKDSNAADIEKLKAILTAQISQLEKDINLRAEHQFQFAQGLAAGADKRFADARVSFRHALMIYKSGRSRGIWTTQTGARCVGNLLVTLQREDQATFRARAKEELASPFYGDLVDELAAAALLWPQLAETIGEGAHAAAAPPPTPAPAPPAPLPDPPPDAHPSGN